MSDSSKVDDANLLPEADACERDPYSLHRWLNWLEKVARTDYLSTASLYGVFERSVAALPGSYKLWRMYSKKARLDSTRYPPGHASRLHALNVCYRAAVTLKTSPRLWEDLIEFSVENALVQSSLSYFDASLRSLPVTQHDRIWNLGYKCLAPNLPPSIRTKFWARYGILRPRKAVELLFRARVAAKLYDEAIVGLLNALKDKDWNPTGSKSRDELWVEAMNLAVTYPSHIKSIDVPKMLRNELQNGGGGLSICDLIRLLAKHFMRLGDFDEVRNVYENAITTTLNVRDFVVLYDAYTKFEENLIKYDMNELKEARNDGETDKEEIEELEKEIEQHLARLEKLADRRPMLLSDVKLRQNQHNVHEWHKRIRMLKKIGDRTRVIEGYEEAIKKVDVQYVSNGRPYTLWLAFASYHESLGEIDESRKILEKALKDATKLGKEQDVAAVWSEYAEMELRLNLPLNALAVLKRAIHQPKEALAYSAQKESKLAVKGRNGLVMYDHFDAGKAWSYWKSPRIWAFCLDLVLALEPIEKFVNMYHEALDKCSSALDAKLVIQGAQILRGKRLFEQSFRLYERAVHELPWEEAKIIWVSYLTAFTHRYGSKKRERTRALFEDALESVPSKENSFSRLIYAMYGRWEIESGSPRIGTSVLRRGSMDNAEAWKISICETGKLFGATATREVYEEALQKLTVRKETVEMAVRFAQLETTLGEIDRAREVYKYAAMNAADPRDDSEWKAWHDFELANGAEDSFRDMLRIRRARVLETTGTHLPMEVVADTDRHANGNGNTTGGIKRRRIDGEEENKEIG